jgi:hypothetical protein
VAVAEVVAVAVFRQDALCLVLLGAERRRVAQRYTMSARQPAKNSIFSDN